MEKVMFGAIVEHSAKLTFPPNTKTGLVSLPEVAYAPSSGCIYTHTLKNNNAYTV